MEIKSYRTLLRASQDELVVNKSRFICRGAPVRSEEEALEFLKYVRGIHPDATHNCYAYAIGPNMGTMRYSDDGEPGGTAGLPMMEVIKNRCVTNCIVVITRYFGGVLLGAGGLVRAYSKSTAMAIEACGVGEVHKTARYLTELAYPMLGKAEYFLKNQPVLIEDKSFTDKVTVTFTVKTVDEDAVVQALNTALDGRADIIRAEEFFMPWAENGEAIP